MMIQSESITENSLVNYGCAVSVARHYIDIKV